jgi:Ca-activated chloride channel family protein
VIAEYRLIGYETRALAREDFNNDRVDAGELGAGHTVTAIYEVTPVGSPAQMVDPLRYSAEASDAPATEATEIGFLRMRWKDPGNSRSELLETPIPVGVVSPGTEARFAAAIAGMGQLLRGSDFVGDWGWDEAIALAQGARGEDPFGYRNEAVQMMRLAQSLSQ